MTEELKKYSHLGRFLEASRQRWLDEQMEVWWLVRESCAFNPSFANSYRAQYQRECVRWETEMLPDLIEAYDNWNKTLDFVDQLPGIVGVTSKPV